MDPLEDHEPDRVDLLNRPAPLQGHQSAGLRAAGAAMAYKLLAAAEDGWRTINGPEQVAARPSRRPIREGARGIIERRRR